MTPLRRQFFKDYLLIFLATFLLISIVFSVFTPIITFELFPLILICGIALTYFVASRTSLRYEISLNRINEVSHAICSGAISTRISLDEKNNSTEFLSAFDAVNRLADKSFKDIEALQRLERVRTEFLGNVSHELRTPIFSIQGFLETLLDGALEDDEVRRKFVEKAYSNTLRLSVLLNDLIEISRIESGDMKFSFRYFALLPLVNEIIASLEFRAVSKKITISISSIQDYSVYGDRDRLAQALTNLIDNAIKYNIEGGTVIISAQKYNGGEILISISDTGFGISKEHQERIFERFYRVDKGRSREVGGTGLGLAIVKHILEAHKSKVTVESIIGKGTTIGFTLKQ